MPFKAAVVSALAAFAVEAAFGPGEEHARRLQEVNQLVHTAEGLTKKMSKNMKSIFKQHRERRLNGIKNYWHGLEELGDFPSNGRQLSTTTFCTWADDACDPSEAWLAAKAAALPATSMLKGEFDKYKACQGKSESACTGTCLWEEGQCEYDLPDTVQQRIMAKITTDEVISKCGWVGSMMKGMKCESYPTSSCPAAEKCAKKTSKEPTGSACEDVEICSVDESKVKSSMCPDSDKSEDEISQECMTGDNMGFNATTGQPDYSAAITCVKGKCEAFGGMMETMLASPCMALQDKAACDGNSKCKWEVHEGEASCSMPQNQLFDTAIPDGCAYKEFFSISATCDAETKEECPTAKCQWVNEWECEDGVSECKGGCEPRSFVVLDMMVQVSNNDNEVKTLGEIEHQGRVCESKDTEALCTAADETMKVNTTATGFGACASAQVDEATRTYTTDVMVASSVALAAFVASQATI